uniref:RRM domain-containing protein n=1 Tax=Triticum urartu TaxID=4572 RepID=A0A8R7PJP0_TRIUA
MMSWEGSSRWNFQRVSENQLHHHLRTPLSRSIKLYVSNLAWKARSADLKEFFSQFNPVSANIVFEDRKSAGYGFVSFGTKEEAEAALTELNGKELMERPVILRWREDKESVKADGEVEGLKVNDQAEGVTVDDSGVVEGEDKQE